MGGELSAHQPTQPYPAQKTKTPAPIRDGSEIPVVPPLLAPHSMCPHCVATSCGARSSQRPLKSGDWSSHNAGPAEAATRPQLRPFTRSAQERTSAGFVRAGLAVNDPTSLAASARVLFSVTACCCSIGVDYRQIRSGVKTRTSSSEFLTFTIPPARTNAFSMASFTV